MSLVDGWRLASGTLTALPVRPPRRVDRETARLSMLLAPLAALPLAVATGLVVAVGAALGLPPLVGGLLGVGVLALGSRAFHLDGLSDTVDGLTASYDRERSLAVMKTGTAGPAGVVALVVVLGLQAAALAELAEGGRAGHGYDAGWPWGGAALAALAVVVSRASLTVCCAHGIPSARPGGLGGLYTGSVPRPAAALVWLVAAALLAAGAHGAGLPLWRGPLAALVALLVLGVLLRHTHRRLGGVTGDVFGAAVELTLAALLVALT